jgi:hypothetical protein
MFTVCIKCGLKFELTSMAVWETTDRWGNKEIVIICPHCGKEYTV